MTAGVGVQCNGCTACCKHDRIFLGRTDDPRTYRCHEEVAPNGKRYAVLDRNQDGSCVYLMPNGCGIFDRAPAICRRMDCRTLYRDTEPAERAQRAIENPQMVLVYRAGRERLHTLKAPT